MQRRTHSEDIAGTSTTHPYLLDTGTTARQCFGDVIQAHPHARLAQRSAIRGGRRAVSRVVGALTFVVHAMDKLQQIHHPPVLFLESGCGSGWRRLHAEIVVNDTALMSAYDVTVLRGGDGGESDMVGKCNGLVGWYFVVCINNMLPHPRSGQRSAGQIQRVHCTLFTQHG